MKRFITVLTTIIATAAIILAVIPTSFADNGDEWFTTNDYHVSIINQRCNPKMTYDNGTIIVTIANPTFDYKVKCTMWAGKDKNKPILELIGTPVQFILPDGAIYYDYMDGRGFDFYSNTSKAGDFKNGYDEKGNATKLSKEIANTVDAVLNGSRTYNPKYIPDICWSIFETNLKARIEQWHYNPVPSNTYDVGPTDINTVIEAAKGTRYEYLVTEWVNKVEAEKAAYYGEPEPIVPAVNTGEFTDVAATHWANANIKKAAKIGAFSGYEDGTFRPDNEITHGEFIKAVVTTVYTNRNVNEAPKAPVTWADWAQPYLNAAFEIDIINRGDNDLISQGTPITRAEMAKVAAPALEYCDKLIEIPNDIDTVFTDWNTIPNHYKPFIAKAYTAGVLSGYEDGTFRPDNTLTRAEAAAIIMRIADFKVEKNPDK